VTRVSKGLVCGEDGQSRCPCDTDVRWGPTSISGGCGTKLSPRDDSHGGYHGCRWATFFVPRGEGLGFASGDKAAEESLNFKILLLKIRGNMIC
jgi:hypothetical protein